MKISLLIWKRIELDLEHLREYAAVIEELLTSRRKEFDSWITEKASKLSEEQKEEFYEFYGDDHWELSEVYPNILRASLFVTCLSLVEHELVSLCGHLYRENNYNLRLDEIAGRGNIYKAKLYLNKVANINSPDDNAWKRLFIYQIIRNSIVHNRGQLKKEEKEVEYYIASSSTVKIDQLRKMSFSDTFCKEAIDYIDNFFKELYAVLN